MTNIFREAKQLLDTKEGSEMTEEELRLVNRAIMPLVMKTNGVFREDITIAEGLEELAKLTE